MRHRRSRVSALGAARRAACALLLLAVVFVPAHAQQSADTMDAALARQVKAAFLYKFLDYVEWPPHAFGDSTSPLVIGVLGSDAVAAEVKDVIGERLARGRPVIVRRVRDGELLHGANVLYITRPESARTAVLAHAARGTGTLIVTEAEDALAMGSAINFRLVDGRVRFDIAPEAAERAGLRISSRLLVVAQSVRTSP